MIKKLTRRKGDPGTPDPRPQAGTPKAPRPAAESTSAATSVAESPDIRARIDKIIDLAEAKRDALDRRTHGQYSALCELERAFAAVLEIQAGERTLHADTDKAGDQQADSMEAELLRRPQRVNKARQALLKTGFPVPDQWLTVDVDFAIGQRCSRPSTLLSGERFCDVTLSGRPGEWRLWWNAPPDPAAIDCCIQEIDAAIMRLETASAVPQAATGTPADLIKTAVATKDYSVSRHTIARYVHTGELRDHRPPGAPTNSPFQLERAAVSARWPRR